jgi:hypothetical protein
MPRKAGRRNRILAEVLVLKTVGFKSWITAIQAFWDPVVTRAAENCSQKPNAYPLMPPFAASFFCNYRQVRR